MAAEGRADAPAVRPAGDGDIEAIAAVAGRAFGANLPAELREEFLRRAYSPQALGQRIAGAAAFLVAELGGRVVGFGQFERGLPEEGEVTALYVEPAARGRRAGSALLAAGEDSLPEARRWRVIADESADWFARRGFSEVRRFQARFGPAPVEAVELVRERRL